MDSTVIIGIALILFFLYILATDGSLDAEIFIAIILMVCILLPLRVLYPRHEFFGMSPGTMDQLQSTHVPTEQDIVYYSSILPKLIRKDITHMTGGDPGVLHPLAYPLGGAYVPMG